MRDYSSPDNALGVVLLVVVVVLAGLVLLAIW